MNTYLAIITTVLVVTQVIRVLQNAISLHRQNEEIKKNLAWINEREIKKQDFDTQRECFRLLKEYLEKELEE